MMKAITALALLIAQAIPAWGGAVRSSLHIPVQPPVQLHQEGADALLAARAAARSSQTGHINTVLAAAQETYAPLPPASLPICKNCSTKGYDTVQVTPDVWGITDGQYWAMAVVSEAGNSASQGYYGTVRGSDKNKKRTLAVVDAPPTITKYVDAIKDILKYTGATTVTDFIMTHHHKDHVDGGNAVLAAWPKARVIAQQAVKEILTDGRSLGNRPVPTVTFKTNFTLPDYGLELYYPGQNHATGNIIVYHPKSKTLLLIDVIFPKWVPFKNLAVSENIPAWIRLYGTVLQYDFKTIIAGHLTTMGDRNDVLQGQQYVNDVYAGAAHALQTVDATKIAADLGVYDPTNTNYGNWWLLFAKYLDACTDMCYEGVKAKWLGVIGAVDVFGWGHCDIAVESVRID